MALLNGTGVVADIVGGLNSVNNALNGQSQNYRPSDFQKDGFIVPPIPGATGDGLPSSKIRSERFGVAKRNIIHWYVPEVGIVNMYINPQGITYNHKKLIQAERTKGGYSLQYFGEQLTDIAIRGHTGSSSVEGINVLYEIYRSEQYLFDPLALTMAANNSISGLNSLVDSALGNLGGLGNTLAAGTKGLLGLDSVGQNILPRSIPSLASMAFGIEMYHRGWVFRGYFNSMSIVESADKIGIFDYDIQFVATQRRGYRTNSFGWEHSATNGPSDHKTIPYSFAGLASDTNIGNNR